MPRAKATDLPGIEGPGVSVPKYKDLDRLGDEFIEVRDEKAKLAEKLGKIEDKIIDAMIDHGLTRYKFADQEAILKPGKQHIKIKTIKAEVGASDAMSGEE